MKKSDLQKKLEDSSFDQKKDVKTLSESDFQQIKIELSETLQDYFSTIKEEMKKDVKEDFFNWISRRLVIIILGGFLTMSVTIGGLTYKFMSEHNQINECKFENQNLKIEFEQKLIKYQILEEVQNFKQKSIQSK